jgi:sulfite exporter TauE/SafE
VIEAIIISGFSLGILSSFHCIGMCGPLALSIPINDASVERKILGSVLYNFGRITTYCLLGVLFGLIGKSFFIAGFQQIFSIILGLVVLIFFVMEILKKPIFFSHKINTFVQKLVLRFLNKKQLYKIYLLGIANGLLPCGMLYLAIAGATSLNAIYKSVLFMTFFGLGTFPAMITLSLFRFSIQSKSRSFIKKLTPYIMAIMGLVLIARGLNLGIPYLSPQLQVSEIENAACH